MKDRIAIVSGAASGIGRACALAIAARGAHIAVVDIDLEGSQETASLIGNAGGSASVHPLDICDLKALSATVAEIESRFSRIDILINNAGVASDFRPLEDLTDALFERMINTHLRGSVFLTKAIIPGMKRRRFGKIVVMGSINGINGAAEHTAYNAAKGALLAVTKGWAKEFAPYNIMVNAVAPGPVLTPMTTTRPNVPASYYAERAAHIPLGRWGQPEDIAHAVSYLSGPESDWVTGQVISPNGGLVIT